MIALLYHRKSGQNFTFSEPFSNRGSNSFLKTTNIFFLVFLLLPVFFKPVPAQDNSFHSLNLPTRKYGLSIGNSREFNGLRINFRDREVDRINGINLTLWRGSQNKYAEVNGVSIGLFAPEAGYLRGVSIGGLAVAADKEILGLAVSLAATGSNGRIQGITLSGIAAGAGESVQGITIAGIAAGSGGNLRGITLAGIGAGSSGNISGITIAGIGTGSNGNIYGLTVAGIGAGSGKNVTGVTIAGIGAGAGGDLTGITIGGIGTGCGGRLTGIAIAGIGAAATEIKGLAVGGLGVGGESIQGVALSLGMIKVAREGLFNGMAVSAYNRILGSQNGVSIGILNVTHHLKGVQFGLVNYVRNNPKFLRILPLVNAHFD